MYGPSDHSASAQFLQGIHDTKALVSGAWILVGDFNLVRCAADKSNGLFKSNLADAFNQTIQDIVVSEVDLSDRRFTWTNSQAFPILAKLDRVFTNVPLDLAFPMANLSSMPRPTSNRTPLLLSLASDIPKPDSFRLDNFLLQNESFLASMTQGWHQAASCSDAAGQLVACIKATRAAAKVWKRWNRAPPEIPQNCQLLIQLFDYFEETRTLSQAEFQVRGLARERLHDEIKAKAVYWRQRSKHKIIKECDANTAYHHARATMQMRRKFIRMVRVNDQEVVSHAGKAEALSNFFKSIIGVPGQVTLVDLDSIYEDSQSLDERISRRFSECELKQAVLAMNSLSAPGPDGFGPAFYQVAWPSIKQTVLAFADAFYEGVADLERINR